MRTGVIVQLSPTDQSRGAGVRPPERSPPQTAWLRHWTLPVLVALQDGRASTQRDLACFAKIEQPPRAQMLARMERDGLIQRALTLPMGEAAASH
jgi:hypothetical protein